jgi:hypothetical protein
MFSPLAKTAVKTTYETFGIDGTPYARNVEELLDFDVK